MNTNLDEEDEELYFKDEEPKGRRWTSFIESNEEDEEPNFKDEDKEPKGRR